MFKSVLDFINYWWFRYLMILELAIVEKWEVVTIRKYFIIFLPEYLIINLLISIQMLYFWWSFFCSGISITPLFCLESKT